MHVIIANMPLTFKEKYPNIVIIIDATEIRIQTPSSLLRQSQIKAIPATSQQTHLKA